MINDLRHIRAFIALARVGSFTRAAVELHVSQPTLTVQIQQLESAIGVKLFDPTNGMLRSRKQGAIFSCLSSAS